MNNKAKARYNSRLSDESDVVPLRQDVDGIDEIPQQQQPSNASLIDHAIKEEAAIQHKQSMVKTSAVNLFWVLMWYTFATVLSIYNKWMFSENHYNFHYPLFVTTFHMIVQFVCSGSTLLVVPKLRPKKRPSSKDYM
ncbi:hypothetical protein BDF20DRAFT_861276 [Mycotypha africana]|uniref:uncharacterized protein n=1 Tax=Mycotypha africana TaxID=64632 RepID=UPI002300A170|nr:uncharacterized protein BDF20DRAFT_861276 [Mycotypha africana]KAI8984699.1 hypothetical protein BDF20DRAFT_861276 [Mycotypha africana]